MMLNWFDILLLSYWLIGIVVYLFCTLSPYAKRNYPKEVQRIRSEFKKRPFEIVMNYLFLSLTWLPIAISMIYKKFSSRL